MNANALARNYASLTPEERFRLILAASGRGDEAERARLSNAGGKIALSLPDHTPYALAFHDVEWLTFMELHEAATLCADGDRLADDTLAIEDDEDDDTEEQEPAADTEEADPGERPAWVRALEPAYAAGFILRTKAAGWKLFCERLSVPPFMLWEGLPGFKYLQRYLAHAEKAAFDAEGMLRFLNASRPAGAAELTKVPLSVEGVADSCEKLFRWRAQWWAGDLPQGG